MNIGIIGGGASGLILASKLDKHSVTVIERNAKLGKKLLLTGNGKCNYTNLCYDDLDTIYNNDFARLVYKKYNNKSFINYLFELGVVPKVEIHRGISYVYPNTNSSKTVLYCLLDKLKDNNVSIELNSFVNAIKKINDKFIVSCDNGKSFEFDKLVISTGGMTYKNTGSDGNGYALSKKLGHSIITPFVGLSSLPYADKTFKSLKGIRINASVKCESLDKPFEEYGEIQFNEGSISGIPIMNLSNFVNNIYFDKIFTICLDFSKIFLLDLENDLINDIDSIDSTEIVIKLLEDRKNKLKNKPMKDFLLGFLPNELADIVLSKAKINKNYVSELDNFNIKQIANTICSFKINVCASKDFDNAQVTLGGVDTKEIDINSLESKLVKGLYFAGEILDINGICGGYNLQLAYSTASIIADSLLGG